MRILAVDPGFRSTGLVVMERNEAQNDGGSWRLIETKCIVTTPDKHKKAMRVAEQDALRVAETVRAVREVVDRNGIRRVVVELPNGGALSARAIRAMALSTGMIIAVIELLGLAYEFYTPSETRLAATGRIKNVSKEEVIEAICGRYPDITSGPKCEMEHICDALATFEAAKNGNLVRMA